MFLLGFEINYRAFLKFVDPIKDSEFSDEAGYFYENYSDLLQNNLKDFMVELFRLNDIYLFRKKFRKENGIPEWEERKLQKEEDLYIDENMKGWQCDRDIPEWFSLLEISLKTDDDESERDVIGMKIDSLDNYDSVYKQFNSYLDKLIEYFDLDEPISLSVWKVVD